MMPFSAPHFGFELRFILSVLIPLAVVCISQRAVHGLVIVKLGNIIRFTSSELRLQPSAANASCQPHITVP